MPARFWLLCGLWLLPAFSARAEGSSQHYVIDARLDPDKHEVYGSLQLTLTNDAAYPLPALLFHLYLNAFRDDKSVFMRESGGSLRGEASTGTGSIELSSLRVNGQERLREADRELLPGDFSQLRLPLSSPLAPGQKLDIEATFVAKLPPAFARAGYVDDFHVVAQWFPKLAKLEPSGQFVGFPYHGLSEFYADFADYDVTLRTPTELTVGATGERIEERTLDGITTRHYRAARVHDFAWVASPSLRVSKLRAGATDVTFLCANSYGLALIEHTRVVARGIEHFARLLGPYPYRTLTVVVPPRAAEGAAGMEYPTLIVTGGNWFPTPFAPGLSGAVVTAHELAHQWFYGLVASNENRYPVLDEGLTEWATLDLLRSMYGPRDLSFDRFEVERATLAYVRSAAPGHEAHAYTAGEYASSIYTRAALVLESVRRAYGNARFAQALGHYARAQAFHHPGPTALASAFDETYGAGFAARVLTPLLFEGRPSSVHIVRASTRAHGKGYRSEVHARRDGVALPCWLSAYDEAGRELLRVPWPDSSDSLHATFETSKPVARVALDADRALLLDGDARDQVWLFRAPARRPLLSQLTAATQLVLGWLGP